MVAIAVFNAKTEKYESVIGLVDHMWINWRYRRDIVYTVDEETKNIELWLKIYEV